MNTTAIELPLPAGEAPEIAEIRAIRAAISAECDHDPWKLVARMRTAEAHAICLQKQVPKTDAR